MATIVRCDRCGAEKFVESRLQMQKNPGAADIGPFPDVKMDLCSSCYEAVKSFAQTSPPKAG